MSGRPKAEPTSQVAEEAKPNEHLISLPDIVHLFIAGATTTTTVWCWWHGGYACIASAIIVASDFYFIFILVEAALRSSPNRVVSINYDERSKIKNGVILHKSPCMFEFPKRRWSLLVVLLMVITVIIGFAAIYENSTLIIVNHKAGLHGLLNSAYFSMVTITTLGDGSMNPVGYMKFFVMLELISGLLLFFCIFPFVISRVSDF